MYFYFFVDITLEPFTLPLATMLRQSSSFRRPMMSTRPFSLRIIQTHRQPKRPWRQCLNKIMYRKMGPRGSALTKLCIDRWTLKKKTTVPDLSKKNKGFDGKCQIAWKFLEINFVYLFTVLTVLLQNLFHLFYIFILSILWY